MEVSFPTDTNGFLSQECPSCEQQFKVVFGEGSDDPISYCPYCGHHGNDCWFTKDQVHYLESVAANVFVMPELQNLERQLKGMSNSFLKVDIKSNPPESVSPPIESDEPLDMVHFPCCGETIKVTPHSEYFCVICGKEIDMKTSESKKVFLSHKGVDKSIVIDFKKSLEVLGYDPWLDEDAMPAGTPLERGLLQGMQDSCAVVFFITSSFKDEGYLETEINYAIQEKRKKGDKFAIVALQFVDAEGKTGVIPELLTTYVWKKPTTKLEALREIIRALPVAPGVIDWRQDITDVVTKPSVKSISTPLSAEAKTILKTAAAGDGHIMHLRHLGGESIQAGGKSLLPDHSARIIAHWVGGLEDLQRRRYIKDVGHKGEVFEVTREGYAAADELSDSREDEVSHNG